jgi:aqualysin 1
MARVDHVYDSALKGFSAAMSARDAERLSNDPRVAFVEEDSYASVSQTSDWGLDRIDQRVLPLDGNFIYAETGQGVNAYIIDTGIRPTHQDFGGRAVAAYDVVGDGQNGIDCNGHGTHVAGTIGSSTYGVAKNVNLYGVESLAAAGTALSPALSAASTGSQLTALIRPS